ncbi:hypothetical protein Scep_007818 [Stephania cephalantha]|uniref:Uncharacterized protein n=1 Tax=Stephania cephalantha TaxID=152367 RepID=A0AAP0KAK3_9MAGN
MALLVLSHYVNPNALIWKLTNTYPLMKQLHPENVARHTEHWTLMVSLVGSHCSRRSPNLISSPSRAVTALLVGDRKVNLGDLVLFEDIWKWGFGFGGFWWWCSDIELLSAGACVFCLRSRGSPRRQLPCPSPSSALSVVVVCFVPHLYPSPSPTLCLTVVCFVPRRRLALSIAVISLCPSPSLLAISSPLSSLSSRYVPPPRLAISLIVVCSCLSS